VLFGNCTGPLTPARTVEITSIRIDPGAFTRQALVLELPLLLALVLPPIAGLATGVATCGEFAPASVGACAAGAGATTNLISLLALALYVPYTTQVEKAVAAIR
jgi:hypothetical protein